MNPAEVLIQELVSRIEPVSESWRTLARNRLDTLTKPLNSLGHLEDLAAQFLAIRRERWREPIRKGVYIFAADHGVCAEGISAYPTEVTRQMVLNFLAGGAAISVLARQLEISLSVIDVGVSADFDTGSNLLHRKVARGTRNMRREAAMSADELAQALAVGIEMADEAQAAGQNLVAIGEMGIGNTTASSAITCCLIGVSAELATGHGTGVHAETFAHKVKIVQESVERHFSIDLPPSPIEILCRVGGFEIAAMVGMMLRAAHHGLVIVMDGFISTAAAALAATLSSNSLGYMIAAHQSEERGHKLLLDHLQKRPLLSLAMRLGEGTGAALAMPLIESAMALYGSMATFESAGVSEVSV